MADPTRDGPPDLVPGFELGEVIGKGGFATVHRARQRSLDRPVAVKIDSRILDDDRNRRRFLREATASALISSHPHVVSLIDAGTTRDNRPYLAMELCDNGSVGQLVKRNGPLPAPDVVELGIAVAGALAAAHEKGILHRDIKPSNILIDPYGIPRLGDFGLAALQAHGDASVTLEALTPAYAAPEAFEQVTPSKRADVWALGATLYAVLTGVAPRHNDDGSPQSVAEIIGALYTPLPSAPHVRGAEALFEVIGRAASPRPEERFADGAQLHDALLELRGRLGRPHGVLAGHEMTRIVPSDVQRVRLPVQTPDSPPSVPPAPLPQPPRQPVAFVASQSPPRRRRVWPVIVVSVLAGGLLGGAGIFAAVSAGRSVTPPVDPPASSPVPAPPSPSPPSDGVGVLIPETPVCFGGIVDIAGVVSARSVDCGSPHHWEAYAVGTLAEDIASPSSDDVAVDGSVVAGCTPERFEAYATLSAAEVSFAVVPPSQSAFATGSRLFHCVASAGESTVTFRR